MKKYHVNSKGEAGACSATNGRCPFGGESEHFTSAEAAREFYEKNQDAALAGASKAARKLAPAPIPTSKSSFDKAVANIPDVADSKVISAPAISDNEGYLGGRRYIGKSRAGVEGFIGQTEASAKLKELVKKAKALGELPQWLDVSVKKNSGAWVTSISVVGGFKPDGGRKVRAIPKEWLEDEDDTGRWTKTTTREPVKKLETYLTSLAREYESSDINGQVDYYNSSNAGRFEWRRAWDDKD